MLQSIVNMSFHGIDTSSWTFGRSTLSGHPSAQDELTIAYIDVPSSRSPARGTVLLIHGFPQTSHQFRHVLNPLASHGYRVIAPDYRGAGQSSRPVDGYDKVTMATDLRTLLHDHLGAKEKIHVVGHDIGGMVAHAYAARFPHDTASVAWGECPLPGSSTYAHFKHSPECWHFTFHNQLDLPELLVAGREKLYISHFFTRLAINHAFVSDTDKEYYATEYATAGGTRAGFSTYRNFERDARENLEWRDKEGKSKVRCCTLNGVGSGWAGEWARKQAEEFYERVDVTDVEGAGHWIAEEQPTRFVKAVADFVNSVSDGL